jgi:hypothetical protein
MKWLKRWNMLHIVRVPSIVQNAASTCLPPLLDAPVVPIGFGLIPEIESVKKWPNLIRQVPK